MPDILKRILAWRSPYFLFVGGIMLLLATYYGAIATDRYVSQAVVIVQNETGAVPSIELGLFSALGSSNSSMQDAELVKAFIESAAMLAYLDEALGLREHYSQPDIDFFSRMDADATAEGFLSYYLDHVEVEIDPDSLTIDIRAQAYAPDYARRLTLAIVERAEAFVNEVSQQLAREQLAFIRQELEMTSQRLQDETNKLIAYQQQNQLLSVDTEAQSVAAIIGGLQSQLATERTELKALLAYLNPTAPEVVAARRRIAAIEEQIEQERQRQIGSKDDPALNQMMLGFKELELRVEIATQMYQTGLQTLETARLDAARKVKYLVSVSPPTLPQSAGEPRRGYILITAFLLLNAVYLIGSLLIATIKDHQE